MYLTVSICEKYVCTYSQKWAEFTVDAEEILLSWLFEESFKFEDSKDFDMLVKVDVTEDSPLVKDWVIDLEVLVFYYFEER